jgi:hypothetical protein
MSTAAEPRAEDIGIGTTWVSKRTLLNLLQVNPDQLETLVRTGVIRRRQIPTMRAQYALEDGLRLRDSGSPARDSSAR